MRLRKQSHELPRRAAVRAQPAPSDGVAYATGLCYAGGMKHERIVKLFKNGRSQAVRIPKEFELPGEDAIMRKEGDRLVIEAARPKSLLAWLATLEPLAEEIGEIEDSPPRSVTL